MTSKEIRSKPTALLEDRIRQIRRDIESIIDARAEAVAKENPGVPSGVVRNLLTARAPACPCPEKPVDTFGANETSWR